MRVTHDYLVCDKCGFEMNWEDAKSDFCEIVSTSWPKQAQPKVIHLCSKCTVHVITHLKGLLDD